VSILKRIFPFLKWFEDYDLVALRADFISGLTVALVLIPQSMAYAQLAGLPPYFGLYAAFLPPVIASLFGSSRQLATGPVAVVSLMTSASLEPLATAGSEQFIAYALLLALMVGLFQLALGVLKLGVVVNFLSHPVVNGFTNAAALIIATSQLSKIFGVYVDNAPHHYETIYRIAVSAYHYLHWPTFAMAAISFITMIVLRRINKRIPQVLVAVVITTFISWTTGFEKRETVSLNQIKSSEAIRVINEFNEAIHTKEVLEAQRSEDKKAWEKLEASGAEMCLRCHERRRIQQNEQGIDSGKAKADASANPLILHDLAGIFEQHLVKIKQSISEHRTKLRGFLFECSTAPDGKKQFYPSGSTPEHVKIQGGTWRLMVGDKPMNPDAMTISGGGAVVAEIPEGLPGFRKPVVDFGIVAELAAAAVIISLLGFMEAISIAKAMAARTRQKLDPNQELIGQGLANIIGSFGQSYAVSGSFSRSAVNFQTGGRTGVSNVFSSVFVMIVLLFLAKGLYHLPQAVLASVIMMAVFGLLNVGGFVHAWRTSRFDGAVSIVTFLGTFIFAPHLEWGIFMGVVLSLGGYLYRTMRPTVIALAPHPEGMMMDAKRHELKSCRHIAVVGFEGPLNFASTNYLEDEITNRVSEFPQLRHLLISGNGISEIDASGEETLRNLVDNLKDAGCRVSFSGFSDKLMDVLERSHFYDHVGKGRFFRTRAHAIAAIYPSAHLEVEEADCPYRIIMPPVVELSLHPDGSLRNAERHGLRSCRHIAALRFDGPITFANAAYMEQEILASLTDRPGLRHVVLVSHSINRIDESGAEKLGDLVKRLQNDGYAVSFSGLKEEVVDFLERAHVAEILGHENIYPTQVTAIAGIYARAHMGSSEENCPLSSLAHRFSELSFHDSGTLREAEQLNLKLCRHIGVLRFDGPLPLSNRKASQSEFIRWAKKRPEVENIVFLGNTLDKLDNSQSANLLALIEAVRDAGYKVALAEFPDRAFEALSRNNAAQAIGLDNFYPTGALAISGIFTEAHADDQEEDCPLRGVLPKLVELAKHPDGSFRDAHRNNLALCQRIAAVRFDGPLNFATIRYFEKTLRKVLERRSSARYVLFAGHTLSGLSSTAAEGLVSFFKQLRSEGYWVGVSGLKDDDLDILRQANHEGVIGKDTFFSTQATAVEHIRGEAHLDCDEDPCPLVEVVQAPK
jgi:SulP family sulfate permease